MLGLCRNVTFPHARQHDAHLEAEQPYGNVKLQKNTSTPFTSTHTHTQNSACKVNVLCLVCQRIPCGVVWL